MLFLLRLGELIRLAVGLKRYGAIAALARMPFLPTGLVRLFRFTTFWVPMRRGLPPEDGARLASALSAFGPAYIKLGQTLATRPDLVGRALAEGLAQLQDRLPPFPAAEAHRAVQEALGKPVAELFAEFEEEAIAAASIAQVHRARTHGGDRVAVKILRPGIERRFLRDLALFEWLAAGAERQSAEARRLRLAAVVAKVRETTLKELDLRLEAASGAELGEDMAGRSGYRIPKIYWPLTTMRVLTTEWIDGCRISDVETLKAQGHDTRALAQEVVQVFLSQAMEYGHFHADLHQGNLLVEPDGTIVAIDFGIMGRLTVEERRYLAEILYGFIRRDYHRVARVHFDAGYVPADQDIGEFAQALRAIAEPIMDLPVHQVSAGKLLAQLFATTQRFQMRTQPQLIVLQRTMVMAEGIALGLDADINMWEASRPVLEAWVRKNLSIEARVKASVRSAARQLERLVHNVNAALEAQASTPEKTEVPARRRWPLVAMALLGGLALGLWGGQFLATLL